MVSVRVEGGREGREARKPFANKISDLQISKEMCGQQTESLS